MAFGGWMILFVALSGVMLAINLLILFYHPNWNDTTLKCDSDNCRKGQQRRMAQIAANTAAGIVSSGSCNLGAARYAQSPNKWSQKPFFYQAADARQGWDCESPLHARCQDLNLAGCSGEGAPGVTALSSIQQLTDHMLWNPDMQPIAPCTPHSQTVKPSICKKRCQARSINTGARWTCADPWARLVVPDPRGKFPSYFAAMQGCGRNHVVEYEFAKKEDDLSGYLFQSTGSQDPTNAFIQTDAPWTLQQLQHGVGTVHLPTGWDDSISGVNPSHNIVTHAKGPQVIHGSASSRTAGPSQNYVHAKKQQ